MGDRNNKRERVEDEIIEYTERRRSTRIIALEEKKREEKEKKKALALERRKIAESRSKDKGKAKINEVYELSDDSSDEDEEQGGPYQYGCRGEALQLNKEGHNGSASRTNVVAVSSIPEIIKTIIGVLQRDDPDMLFVVPANLDDVEGTSNPIVKQPMDFATMLARMYDGYYTTLDLFKRDVFLMCSNALSTNPANSRHYKVAKDMFAHAKRIFDDINAEIEQFGLEPSQAHKTPIRKQDSQRRTSRNPRVPPKSAGKGKAAISEVGNRNIHPTPSRNPSILTEFQQVYMPGIHFNQDPSNYRESLLKFVGDLGPVAKRVAARKLQAIEFQQLLHPNPTSNIDSSSVITVASPSLNNRPLTLIPDTCTQQKGNGNCWHAYSAAFLANHIFNNANTGARHNNNNGVGVGAGGSSNARGTALEIGNGFSATPIPFKEGSSRHHELQLGNSRTASPLVLPTVMIPSAEAGEGSSGGGSRRPSLFPSQQGYRPNMVSLSDFSLQNQPRPTQTNLTGSSILPQQVMMGQANAFRSNYSNKTNNNKLNIAMQQHGVMPQQVAHFATESGTSMYSLGKEGSFQALLGSSLDLNYSSPYQMQPNQNQFLHQAAPNTTPPTTQGIHPDQVINLQAPPNLQQLKSIPSSQMNQVPSQVPSQAMNNQTQPHLQQPRPFSTNQMNREPNQVMNRQVPSHLQQPRPSSTNQANPVLSQVMNLRAPAHLQPPRQVPNLPVPFGSALIGGAGTSHDEDTDAVKFTWDVEDPPNLNLGL